MSEAKRVLLHFRDGRLYAHCAEIGVQVVSIDEMAPDDRVYVSEGKFTPDEFDVEVDKAIRGEDHDIGAGLEP